MAMDDGVRSTTKDEYFFHRLYRFIVVFIFFLPEENPILLV